MSALSRLMSREVDSSAFIRYTHDAVKAVEVVERKGIAR
jgi:hypothetical protein